MTNNDTTHRVSLTNMPDVVDTLLVDAHLAGLTLVALQDTVILNCVACYMC